jgi:hypothetical protein
LGSKDNTSGSTKQQIAIEVGGVVPFQGKHIPSPSNFPEFIKTI